MAHTGEVQTYKQLDDESARLARFMWAQGLRPGDHVAVFADNHPKYLETYWGALRSGHYYTTVNRYLTAAEAAYIVNDCGATMLIASPAVREVAVEMLALLDGCPVRLMFDDAAPGFELYGAAVAGHSADPLDDQPRGSTMLYSSGTTGRPKGIRRPLTGEQITENDLVGQALIGGLLGFDQSTVYLSPAPLYHSAPLGFTTGTHSQGGTVVVMDRFDAVEALDFIDRWRITHSQWVPTMFSRMLKLPEADRAGRDFSAHKMAVHAAAPCPVEVKRRMIEWWGPILTEYYAGTELNGFCYVTSEEWLERPGTVGRSLIGTVHICDDEGVELPAGEVGTIYFERDEHVFEYHNDDAKTAESRHEAHEFWSTLGDVGRLDDDGYLYLTDRKSFMIISGGVNIYPQEIEDCLVLHPKVADVAVFGVPNEDFGEEVKAVCRPADGVAGDEALAGELTAYAREHLANYKVPRSIDFRDELPRLPTGKLYKRILRDEYWGGKSSEIV
ncbi:MAG TPA: acyl-CoA synthetase [Acidimicrobiaceae bacterium]|nr:acyl-CoA synthetase [Acidimicrobiaceae bacterium]